MISDAWDAIMKVEIKSAKLKDCFNYIIIWYNANFNTKLLPIFYPGFCVMKYGTVNLENLLKT